MLSDTSMFLFGRTRKVLGEEQTSTEYSLLLEILSKGKRKRDDMAPAKSLKVK